MFYDKLVDNAAPARFQCTRDAASRLANLAAPGAAMLSAQFFLFDNCRFVGRPIIAPLSFAASTPPQPIFPRGVFAR
jgi:hypothetical protein